MTSAGGSDGELNAGRRGEPVHGISVVPAQDVLGYLEQHHEFAAENDAAGGVRHVVAGVSGVHVHLAVEKLRLAFGFALGEHIDREAADYRAVGRLVGNYVRGPRSFQRTVLVDGLAGKGAGGVRRGHLGSVLELVVFVVPPSAGHLERPHKGALGRKETSDDVVAGKRHHHQALQIVAYTHNIPPVTGRNIEFRH